MKGLSPLQESLVILGVLKTEIKAALGSIKAKDRIWDEDLKFTVCKYLTILICSFMEEWHRIERLGHDPDVRYSLRIASPAVERIKKWKGLRKVRSTLFAHAHREANGEITLPGEVFVKYQAPTAYAGTILLANCAIKATDVVLHSHLIKYKEALEIVLARNLTPEAKGIQTSGEIKAELAKVDKEIEKKRESKKGSI